MLTIRLLGPLEVAVDFAPVRLPTGNGRRLLECLLVQPGGGVPRDRLVARLWPGHPPTDPATLQRLQASVSRLRRWLRQAQATPRGHRRAETASTDPVTVTATEHGYRLDGDLDGIDVLRFEAATSDAADPSLDAHETLEHIDRALALWGGEPFTGFSLDEEVDRERERLDRQRRDLLARRARLRPTTTGDDVPLGIKIHRPDVSHASLLRRGRLLRGLPAAGSRGVITVSAPAGYGKSVLLAQWAEEQEAPVAWLRLDPDDAAPVRFWSTVATSIEVVAPDHVGDLGPHVDPEAFPFRLAERLDRNGPLGIVLDDLHVVQDPAVLGQLSTLVGLLPERTTLAFGSRADIDATVAPAYARGDVHRVDADALAFEPTEVTRLCLAVAGEDADVPEVTSRARAIVRRSDGWPLAAASFARAAVHPGEDRTVDRAVGRHLVAQVLDGLPEGVRRFVRATAHLEQLHPDLCAAVTGSGDSHAHLAWLRNRDLLLAASNDRSAWSRYHDVIRDELRAETELDPGLDLPELHHRAAQWHLERGLDEAAVEHAVKGGHVRLVAHRLGAVLMDVYRTGEAVRVWRWLSTIDPAEVADAPDSHRIAAATAAVWTHLEVSNRWRDSLRAHTSPDDPALGFAEAVRLADQGWARRAEDLTEQVLQRLAGRDVEADSPVAAFLRANALSNLLLARLMGDRLCAKDPILPEVVAELRNVGTTLASYQYLYWALAAFADGQDGLAASLSVAFRSGAAALGEGEVRDVAGLPVPSELVDDRVGRSPTALVDHLLLARGEEDPDVLRSLAAPLETSAAMYEFAGASTRVALLRMAVAHLHTRASDDDQALELRRRAEVARRALPDAPFADRFDRAMRRDRTPASMTSPIRTGQGTVSLTPRQKEVLALLDSALPTAAIADRLHVSPHTVRSHVRAIYTKLEVDSRHHAVARAAELGLITNGRR